MVHPEPPEPLRPYQPHLRYYLIDEGRYTDSELGLRQSSLSGVFGVENAGESWEALQQSVDRIVAIIQANPDKERVDRIITRWLKRHLQRVGAGVDLERLNSLVEDKDMLAENLEKMVNKERQEGMEQGLRQGRQEAKQQTARNLIKLGVLSDEQIAEATALRVADVRHLRAEDQH